MWDQLEIFRQAQNMRIYFVMLIVNKIIEFWMLCAVNLSFSFKVGLSPSKNESTLKIMKNAFYFILKALFVRKIFEFLSLFFGQVEKRFD